MKDKIAEKLLLYKVQIKKDSEAFGTLYDDYVDRIYRFIFLKISSREEAEDTTSEVFLKAWNYLTHVEKKKVYSFSGLIYKIARNCIIDVYRKRAARQEYSIEYLSSLPNRETEIGSTEPNSEAGLLLESIKKLKSEYQEIIMLRYIDGLSISEIAEALEKSSVSVRVTLHRALKILKNISE
jgi:RNA polymerase sigma-70 factor (ECF subfamily)